jgi:hypothetical protein
MTRIKRSRFGTAKSRALPDRAGRTPALHGLTAQSLGKGGGALTGIADANGRHAHRGIQVLQRISRADP